LRHPLPAAVAARLRYPVLMPDDLYERDILACRNVNPPCCAVLPGER